MWCTCVVKGATTFPHPKVITYFIKEGRKGGRKEEEEKWCVSRKSFTVSFSNKKDKLSIILTNNKCDKYFRVCNIHILVCCNFICIFIFYGLHTYNGLLMDRRLGWNFDYFQRWLVIIIDYYDGLFVGGWEEKKEEEMMMMMMIASTHMTRRVGIFFFGINFHVHLMHDVAVN